MEIKYKKTRSAIDFAITFIVLAAGVASLFVKSDSMFILGVTLIAVGILLFFVLKSNYIIEGVRGVYKREIKDYPNVMKNEVLAFLDGKSDKLGNSSAGSLLLYVYYDSSKTKGYAVLNEYDQYEYRPSTGLVELDEKRLSVLLK